MCTYIYIYIYVCVPPAEGPGTARRGVTAAAVGHRAACRGAWGARTVKDPTAAAVGPGGGG